MALHCLRRYQRVELNSDSVSERRGTEYSPRQLQVLARSVRVLPLAAGVIEAILRSAAEV